MPAPPPKPKIRTVTSWIMRDPSTLPTVTKHISPLEYPVVMSFAVMTRDLRGDRLSEWVAQVRADDRPALHAFVTGLEHDFAAVTAGLTLPWSTRSYRRHG